MYLSQILRKKKPVKKSVSTATPKKSYRIPISKQKNRPDFGTKKRYVRYLEIKYKHEPVVYQVSAIRYRDKNGKISKFKKGKKLSVEILAKKKLFDKKQGKWVEVNRVIRKHGLKLAKRKRPVTIDATNKRIIRKAKKNRKGQTVIMDGGIIRFISP